MMDVIENEVVTTTVDESSAPIVSDDTANDSELSALKAEIENLKGINKDVIASRDSVKSKLKDLETNKEVAALEEKGQYDEALQKEKEKYQTLQTKLEAQAVTGTLIQELGNTNALSVDTALELIDRSTIVYEDGQVNKESVADAISALQEKHSVLFGENKPAPKPKKAGEEKSTGGYVADLKKLQQNPRSTRTDLEKLRTKYGKQ